MSKFLKLCIPYTASQLKQNPSTEEPTGEFRCEPGKELKTNQKKNQNKLALKRRMLAWMEPVVMKTCLLMCFVFFDNSLHEFVAFTA